MSQINLQHGTTTDRGEQEEWKTKEWKWLCLEVSVNSLGNPWSRSRRRKGRLWWERLAEKESFKPGVEEWRGDEWWDNNNNESGESMELMEEMPLKDLGEAELERFVRGWRRGAGSWFQRRGKHTGRNLSLIHIWRCRRSTLCRSRWSPYH